MPLTLCQVRATLYSMSEQSSQVTPARVSGPASEPVNITKSVRTHHNFGINSFADYAGVKPQTILRTDQGTYRKIPENVLIALMHLEPSKTPNAFQHEYRQFVKLHRRWAEKNKPLLYDALYGYLPKRDQDHPLTVWRKKSGYSSRMGFCTAYCLHPSTIRRFEVGQTQVIPEQLHEMLVDTFRDASGKIEKELRGRTMVWLSRGDSVEASA